MDVAAIRDRIKTRIETTGLACYDTMPDSPVVPCATVAPPAGPFLTEVAMGGAEDLQLVVTVLVKKVAADTAQDALDTYLSEGASNIADAVDSGATADWDFADTMPARNYGTYTFGEGEAAARYLGFEIPVHVAAS